MSELLVLSDEKFMNALLNLVIPPSASGRLPGAGDLGLSPQVAAGLQADPMLGPLVTAGVLALREAALSRGSEGLQGLSPDEGTEVVQAQVSANPFVMMGLLRYLYPAYYQHPRVLAGIGVEVRPPFPKGFDVDATDASLLKKLEQRSIRGRSPQRKGGEERVNT